MKRILISIILILTMFINSSCTDENDYLIVVTDATCAPFEFINTDNHEIVGFDIDLFNEIADRLDIKVKYVNVPWDTMLTSVTNGTYKICISAVTITNDRNQKIDFSNSYFESGQVLIINEDNSGFKTLTECNNKAVGCESGTIASTLLAISGAKVYSYDDLSMGIIALQNKQIDAVMCDKVFADYYINNNTGLKIASDYLTEESFGICYTKDYNKELQDLINEKLTEIKSDGTFDQLLDKWNINQQDE